MVTKMKYLAILTLLISAIANAEQNQQTMNQVQTTRISPSRDNASVASLTNIIPAVVVPTPTEASVSQARNLSAEVHRSNKLRNRKSTVRQTNRNSEKNQKSSTEDFRS